MNPARWSRLSALFDAALDLSTDARADYIAHNCADDADLATRLRHMLDADAQAASEEFLDPPAGPSGALLDIGADNDTPGLLHFGAYRLIRPIGAGGMGEVHLAGRSDGQFEQRVALKLLPQPTPGLMRRFRQERQILAHLEHPNIARLLDGGVGENGVPYFAMEFVDGTPITAYVAANRLDASATLKLFLSVCDAVQYAHRNLVVHRDIKPSNILVGADGAPKLLDFGIAKLLQTTDAADGTQTAARAFTPDYAAPEQIRGDPVTTATDVYALGVVLYELLAGTRPYKLKRSESPEQAILTVEPAAPSSVAARNGNSSKALRGDVDRIVLTALAKEPERRYASVEALAADIRRHLDGHPVAARGDAAMYRMRKFIRRNRVMAAAAAIVVAVLVAATGVSLYAAHVARSEAQLAEQKSRTTEAVKDYLLSVFASANPYKTDGRTVTARDLLEGGLEQVDKKLNGQPQVQAEIYAGFVETFLQLGQVDLGQRAARQAISAYRQFLPADAIEVLRMETNLAQADFSQTRFDGLVPRFHDLLARIGTRGGDYAALRGDVLILLSMTQYRMGKFAEAIATGESAMAQVGSAQGEKSYDISIVMYSIALMRISQGRFADAAALIDRFTTLDRSLVGPQHPGLVTDVTVIGRLMHYSGRLREAHELLAAAVSMRQRQFSLAHPLTIRTRDFLASVDCDRGDGPASESAFAEIIAQTIAAANFAVTDLADSYIHRAQCLIRLDRLAEARRALEAARVQVGLVASEDTPMPLAIAAMLADIDRREGRASEALIRLAPIIEQQRRRDDRDLPASLLASARAHLALGQPAAAELAEANSVLIRQGRAASTQAGDVELELAALLPSTASSRADHLGKAAAIGCVNFGCDDARVIERIRATAAAGPTPATQDTIDTAAARIAKAAATLGKPFETEYAIAADILAKANAVGDAAAR